MPSAAKGFWEAAFALLFVLQELEVWTRSAADWSEDVSFLPFCSCKTLRSLKLEVGITFQSVRS